MRISLRLIAGSLLLVFLFLGHGIASEQSPAREDGTIFTFWPLVDYRESPAEGYSNLSILGPLFKLQRQGGATDVALRPLVYSQQHSTNKTVENNYLYPLASSKSTPEMTRFEVLKLISKDIYREDQPEEKEQTSMLFPFYISGTSKKYGPYTSILPLYGDIYEHFWRDEYHYVLFPLYGRTVKDGITNYNVLYPFFGATSGNGASGFRAWPLYGQSERPGDFRQRFVLWPFYTSSSAGLATDNPVEKVAFFPLYDRMTSPKAESWHVFWPFFGHVTDRGKKYEEWDYGWPLFWSASGEGRNAVSVMPLFMSDRRSDSLRYWVLWPLYKHSEQWSDTFCEERDRLLFFLYTDQRESWPQDRVSRRRAAFWPLYAYRRDEQGRRTFSFPAPVESFLSRDEIERSWAPFWRLYIQRWNEQGDSAVSFLWNLYWHEAQGKRLAYEFFPLASYQGSESGSDFSFLKGLVRYRNDQRGKNLSFFWLPFGFSWDAAGPAAGGGKQ